MNTPIQLLLLGDVFIDLNPVEFERRAHRTGSAGPEGAVLIETQHEPVRLASYHFNLEQIMHALFPFVWREDTSGSIAAVWSPPGGRRRSGRRGPARYRRGEMERAGLP